MFNFLVKIDIDKKRGKSEIKISGKILRNWGYFLILYNHSILQTKPKIYDIRRN